MRLRLLGAVMAVCCLGLVSAPKTWADNPPGSQSGNIKTCPAGTTAAVVSGKLKCSLTLACASGFTGFQVGQGLICFKRENAVVAADCNECHAGAHVQVAQNGADTCKLGGIGGSEPDKLACCNNAIRWTDKDGNLDVCGFFAAPAPE